MAAFLATTVGRASVDSGVTGAPGALAFYFSELEFKEPAVASGSYRRQSSLEFPWQSVYTGYRALGVREARGYNVRMGTRAVVSQTWSACSLVLH